MPLVEVTLTSGRSDEQLRALFSKLTHATADAIDAPAGNIRVVIRGVPAEHWTAGDVTIADRKSGRTDE